MGGVVAGEEGVPGDGGEVVGAPGGLFGGFDEDGVAAEEGGDDGGDEVVELVGGGPVSELGKGGGTKGKWGLEREGYGIAVRC